MKRKIFACSHGEEHFKVGQEMGEVEVESLLYCDIKGRDFVDMKLSTGHTLRMFEPSQIMFESRSEGFDYDFEVPEMDYLVQLDKDNVIGKDMDEIYGDYSQWCKEHFTVALAKYEIKNLIKEGLKLDYHKVFKEREGL